MIDKVTRFGIRYLDFFESDIFEKLKLRILLDEKQVISDSILFRVVFERDKFRSALQLSNDATMHDHEIIRKGSLLDLDTYLAASNDTFFEHMTAILSDAHLVEKELFFSLLHPEFLESLNPTY